MAEHHLPKISEATREKLTAYGFNNHLYDSLQLPSVFIPRGSGCTSVFTQSTPTPTSP
jgi:hypothetical protein